MDRQGKEQIIAKLREITSQAQLMVQVDYRGLTVAEMNALRRLIDKSARCDFLVAKNTLARRAMTGTSFEKYADHLVGTNALLFAYEDPVNPVKALIDYAKSVPKIEIKGAVLAGKALTADQLKELAKMPSRIEMLSMVAGVLNAPIRNLASALANVPRGLVNVLVAVKEQKEKAAA